MQSLEVKCVLSRDVSVNSRKSAVTCATSLYTPPLNHFLPTSPASLTVSSLTPLTRLATNIASFLNLNLSKIHEQPKMVDEQHISGSATHDMSEDYLHALHNQLRLIDSGESLEDSYDPEMHQPFDLSWLYHLDSSLVSDFITQILTWSSSVSHPILAQWYGECNLWLYDKTPIANRIRADMSGFDRLAVSRALCCPPDDTRMADSGESVSGSYEPSSEEVQAVISACRLAMSRAPYRYRSPDDVRND
jgi:hypothetical protein